ncbi:TfoX/Sxy family protein [Sphingomonas sp. S1-29]|uniref:TfoX/Sxy family protein n=1 Tax=Sphingomonas sp. S1-29 TaxID=2991074 RepID=UPI00223F72DC|nr:TfoX/Sxy family protein [Sphingomonas sp. S1-29]UZK70473.1 TfoX/Sxy family protein [Sphingomonas sp. S1-29]
MATQQRTVDYLLEQATAAGTVSTKPMFGEYSVYIDGKMIGSVCDDQLYVKPFASMPSPYRKLRRIQEPSCTY